MRLCSRPVPGTLGQERDGRVATFLSWNWAIATGSGWFSTLGQKVTWNLSKLGHLGWLHGCMSHPETKQRAKTVPRCWLVTGNKKRLFWKSDGQWSEQVSVKREGGQPRWGEVGLCWEAGALRGPGIWDFRAPRSCQTHTHYACSCVSRGLFDWLCKLLCFGLCIFVCGSVSVHGRLSAREYCTSASNANPSPCKQAKFVGPQRKSTVWVVQSRPTTMAPFIELRWGHGGDQRKRESVRGGIGCVTSASHCSHSIQCVPQRWLTWAEEKKLRLVASNWSADFNAASNPGKRWKRRKVVKRMV